MSFSGNNGRQAGSKNKSITVKAKFSVYNQMSNDVIRVRPNEVENTITVDFGSTLSISLTKAGLRELKAQMNKAEKDLESYKEEQKKIDKIPLKLK